MTRLPASLVLGTLLVVLSFNRVSAQQPLSIRITAPAAGATVANPVQLHVEIGGGDVKDATVGDPQALHYHILVDVDPATVILPGQPLPTGRANVIHTANLDYPVGNLAPGPHTITTVLTRTDHVPLNPNVMSQVSFVVAAAQATATAAAQATVAATPAASPPAGVPRTGAGPAVEHALPTRTLAGAILVVVALTLSAVYVRARRASPWRRRRVRKEH